MGGGGGGESSTDPPMGKAVVPFPWFGRCFFFLLVNQELGHNVWLYPLHIMTQPVAYLAYLVGGGGGGGGKRLGRARGNVYSGGSRISKKGGGRENPFA